MWNEIYFQKNGIRNFDYALDDALDEVPVRSLSNSISWQTKPRMNKFYSALLTHFSQKNNFAFNCFAIFTTFC